MNRREGIREIICSIGIFNLAWSDEESGIYSTDKDRPAKCRMVEGKAEIGKMFQELVRESYARSGKFPGGRIPLDQLQRFYDSLPRGE